MRTRIFSTPTSGTPTAYWQDGDATTGQTGSLLPFSTPSGSPAGSGGTLSGPGSYISAQFSLAGAPSTLYVALATDGSAAGVGVNLESYSNFTWVVLDSSALSAPAATVNLPAANALGLLRLRVSVTGRATAQCVPILNTTAPAQGGGGNPPTTTSDERAGLINIPNGADRVNIAFSPAFDAAPLPPACQVLKAADGDPNVFCVGVESLTASSCVALLSSAAPNGNYKLSFRARSAS